ncbi:MAG TPA: SLC13 family permease [Oleiagrimonas sp.]|nr:SLC13 family permease [Oleiagrimonas sp.]
MLFLLVAAVLAICDPRAPSAWLDWLDWPTLAGLTGLMVAVQGIGDSALAERAAGRLLARLHSVRAVGMALVLASAALAMVLTNDVSLLLMVPLTLALGADGCLPLGRLITLEAFAVNAGSTLSPIGNPQNLLLWQHSGLGFAGFVQAMWPAACVMLALTVLLTLAWLPGTRIPRRSMPARTTHRKLGVLSLLALAGMVLAMQWGHALAGAAIVVATYAVVARHSLRRVDWMLLVTFAAIFVALGHLSAWPPLAALLDPLHLERSGQLYVAGIVGSQIISNVPASVLLMGYTTHETLLAVAVNVGGYGLAIGSLANLIALRLARTELTMTQFHRVSIPFLLVCACAVYAAMLL